MNWIMRRKLRKKQALDKTLHNFTKSDLERREVRGLIAEANP
jgi:hypothetical protein